MAIIKKFKINSESRDIRDKLLADEGIDHIIKDLTDASESDTDALITANVAADLAEAVVNVNDRIDKLPTPMQYKGTLGTGGTITSLPAAAASNDGFTYKVITDGTYASQVAKVGDVFISNGSAWTLVPSGDDIEDTWREIKVNGTQLLGSGISTGALDVLSGTGINLGTTNSQLTINVVTATNSQVDSLF